MIRSIFFAIGVTSAVAIMAAGGITGWEGVATAQGEAPLAPQSVTVANGPNPGEAVLSWGAVALDQPSAIRYDLDGDHGLATGRDDAREFGASNQYPPLQGVGAETGRTSADELDKPANLRVAAIGDGQATLEWQPANNAGAHRVAWYEYDSVGDETLVDVLQVSGDASSATITGLENGWLYGFVAFTSRAVDGPQQYSQERNWVQAQPSDAGSPGSLPIADWTLMGAAERTPSGSVVLTPAERLQIGYLFHC